MHQQRSGEKGSGIDVAELVKPHQTLLLRLAQRLTRNFADADDLVQGFMLKLHAQRHRLVSIRELRPWLVRALYHHFIDLHRSQLRQRGLFVDDAGIEAAAPEPEALGAGAVGLTSPEDGAFSAQLHACIDLAVARLSSTQRLVVTQHDLQGRTISEIAQDQGLSANTLKSALVQAHRHLREQLAAFDAVDPALVRDRFTGARRHGGPAAWPGGVRWARNGVGGG